MLFRSLNVFIQWPGYLIRIPLTRSSLCLLYSSPRLQAIAQNTAHREYYARVQKSIAVSNLAKMSSTEGRQSPPPETQTDAQIKSAPGSGQGLDDTPKDKGQANTDQLENLSSNPKGPLDDAVKEKADGPRKA